MKAAVGDHRDFKKVGTSPTKASSRKLLAPTEEAAGGEADGEEAAAT